MANDNKSLGTFVLDGIAPAPRGVPQIEVTFNLDANGILNVTAKDKATGKENSVTIQDSGNMSKEDIEKAQKEAEAHADEDKKKREAVDAKNALENGIYQAEKMPKEFEGKISDDDKKVIDEAVAEAKKHLESDDKDELEKAANELLEKIQGIGAKLYEAAAKEEAADEDKKSDDKDEPVEGEVVEDDGKKGKK
jgi:molecular chaperone DnaK